MTIEVDYFVFIAKGEFGLFKFGTSWNQVINVLGVPPLYEPPGEGTAALARYGDLEFAIVDERVVTISLQVDQSGIELPANVSVINFESAQLETAKVKDILRMYDITWERVELLCDDWIDYYRTSTGVHLSFGGSLLGKVGAADPDKFWGI
ncbi:MAG TPA: hypothetical protein DCL61_11280 [Cyanobacteria bacterium UBA12227]|nr:hypothetical protein [Cyanobacteria bacterium UBA12227]HAX87278.1 hypothetical protein [Cyanobacteria bacterium UBA11370]